MNIYYCCDEFGNFGSYVDASSFEEAEEKFCSWYDLEYCESYLHESDVDLHVGGD